VTDEVFVVASDKDNVLRCYSWASPGLAIAERGLSEFVRRGRAGNGHRSGRSTRWCQYAGIGFELSVHTAAVA
jgi:hypothetical protein